MYSMSEQLMSCYWTHNFFHHLYSCSLLYLKTSHKNPFHLHLLFSFLNIKMKRQEMELHTKKQSSALGVF